jgi:hypothetical protein
MDSGLEFGWCPLSRPGEPVDALLLGAGSRHFVVFAHLRPGRYYLRGYARWPEPAEIDWSLRRVEPTCSQPLDADPSSPLLLAAPPPDQAMLLPLRFGADTRVLPLWAEGGLGEVVLCSDCSLSDCVPFRVDTPLTFSRGDRRVLVVRSSVWEQIAVARFGPP